MNKDQIEGLISELTLQEKLDMVMSCLPQKELSG